MVRGNHKKNTPSEESQDPLVYGRIVCSAEEDYCAARVLAAAMPNGATIEDVMEVLAAAGILNSAVYGHKARLATRLRKILIRAG